MSVNADLYHEVGGDVLSVTVIVDGNGINNPNSDPGCGCLRFTQR